VSNIKYQSRGVKVTVDQPATVELPPRVLRARLTGFLFEPAKTFLLPSAMNGIASLVRFYNEHPNVRVVVSGHTDTVGPDDYNRGLSMERAQSVAAFLTDDHATWMKWYRGGPCSNAWGVLEDQYMLKELGFSCPVNGQLDDATRKAYADVGGTGPDDATREKLVRRYMAIDGTSFPPDAPKPLTHGCGPWHPAVKTGPNVDNQENRRVEVFLFEGEVAPPPKSLCPWNGCTEYPTWVRRTRYTVDLGQDLGRLTVIVADETGARLARASVRVEGSVGVDERTDATGAAVFDRLPGGRYAVTASKRGYLPTTLPVDVHPGKHVILHHGGAEAASVALKIEGERGPGGNGDGQGDQVDPVLRRNPDDFIVKVTDDEDNPLPAADVALNGPNDLKIPLTEDPDEPGTYFTSGGSGTLQLTVGKWGFIGSGQKVTLPSPTVTIQLDGNARMLVRAIVDCGCTPANPRGPAIEGAQIALASSRHQYQATADHNGEWVFDGLTPKRTYDVTVAATDFNRANVRLTMARPNQREDVKLTLTSTSSSDLRKRIVALADAEQKAWDAAFRAAQQANKPKPNQPRWFRLNDYFKVFKPGSSWYFTGAVPEPEGDPFVDPTGRQKDPKFVPDLYKGIDNKTEWCGIFATWVVWAAANPCVYFLVGTGPNGWQGAQGFAVDGTPSNNWSAAQRRLVEQKLGVTLTPPSNYEGIEPGDVIRFRSKFDDPNYVQAEREQRIQAWLALHANDQPPKTRADAEAANPPGHPTEHHGLFIARNGNLMTTIEGNVSFADSTTDPSMVVRTDRPLRDISFYYKAVL
jgi:outer membrane protein OmpA-like peptidoglycan-associated protein